MNLPLEKAQTVIWIIDDDQSMRWVLEKTLSNNGYQVTAFESGSVTLAMEYISRQAMAPFTMI